MGILVWRNKHKFPQGTHDRWNQWQTGWMCNHLPHLDDSQSQHGTHNAMCHIHFYQWFYWKKKNLRFTAITKQQLWLPVAAFQCDFLTITLCQCAFAICWYTIGHVTHKATFIVASDACGSLVVVVSAILVCMTIAGVEVWLLCNSRCIAVRFCWLMVVEKCSYTCQQIEKWNRQLKMWCAHLIVQYQRVPCHWRWMCWLWNHHS